MQATQSVAVPNFFRDYHSFVFLRFTVVHSGLSRLSGSWLDIQNESPEDTMQTNRETDSGEDIYEVVLLNGKRRDGDDGRPYEEEPEATASFTRDNET